MVVMSSLLEFRPFLVLDLCCLFPTLILLSSRVAFHLGKYHVSAGAQVSMVKFCKASSSLDVGFLSGN